MRDDEARPAAEVVIARLRRPRHFGDCEVMMALGLGWSGPSTQRRKGSCHAGQGSVIELILIHAWND